MAAFASVQDVADTWRPLTAAEQALASVLLARVSALIRLRVYNIDARAAADSNLAVVVKGVAVDAVLRVLRNPAGKVTESIDDYTYRRADAVADGVLYVTDDEWSMLSPADNPAGAFTIRPGIRV
jgi:hypothetical protein